MGPGELVRRFDYVGDTGGDEAGTKTSVTITFNDIHLVLTQTANCVPDTAIKALQLKGMLSTRAFTRLNPAMVMQLQKREMVFQPHQ
jgi:hypothetical protein